MTTEITAKQEAEQLHEQIINYGTMAATALYEMARCLKRMRDAQLYLQRGCETFEEYVERDVGIGQRHAYNYIHIYEQLGDTVLQSNAKLGITKLELIARAPLEERQTLLEDPNTETESVAKLKQKIAELTKRGEQLSFLTEENEQLKKELQEAEEECAELQEAANASTNVVSGYTEEDLEKEVAAVRESAYDAGFKEAEREQKALMDAAKREQKKAVEEAKKKAKTDAEKALKAEHEKAIAEAVAKARDEERAKLGRVEQEAAAAIERSKRLEKQLALAGDEDTTAVSLLFEQMQDIGNKLGGRIQNVSTKDPEAAEKLKKAVCQLMDVIKATVGGDIGG